MIPYHTTFILYSTERLQIFTPNKHEFTYLPKPEHLGNDILRISVRATNDVHVALSTQPHDAPDMYEVVLGGRANTLSWISLGKDGKWVYKHYCSVIIQYDEDSCIERYRKT